MKLLIGFFLTVVFCSATSFLVPKNESSKHNITVTISNVRNSNGRIQLQVYRTSESFAAENPYKELYVSKSSLKNKTMTYTIYGLESGTYGLALLDDENANKKMDYGWVMPEEGFGFSDYYHASWSKPKFDQFKFSLSSDKKVGMKIRYL